MNSLGKSFAFSEYLVDFSSLCVTGKAKRNTRDKPSIGCLDHLILFVSVMPFLSPATLAPPGVRAHPPARRLQVNLSCLI